MKGKIPSFEIALSAMATAVATAFLSLGVLNNLLLATGYIIACFAMMVPLSRRFIWGGVLSYLATILLTFLFGGLSFPWRLVPFALVFGLHPLVNFLEVKHGWNKYLLLVVKAVWFDISVIVSYKLWMEFGGFSATFDWIDEYLYPLVFVAGTLFFVVYDNMIIRCQMTVDRIVKRIKKD